ncbi:unnamed protein product [Didymodactylos carnosus]|uniref:Aminoacyl-tRNA synthetase class Ia domain-containing protein n=1 Tax=Didymodactylos carnosus TaxID=1234261 RepID=A0A8S2H1B2_9BILA|nr:unnamed protein product [Didymodactylos carnosus]CAF3587380.1 unnamed protein product [Didymodactylos carnosus]
MGYKHEMVDHSKGNHPLYPQQIASVLSAEFVQADEGTGLVHLASGFGEEDWLVCSQNGISTFAPIGPNGKFTEKIKDPLLVGIFYQSANPLIVKRLNENEHLLSETIVQHSAGID